MFILRLDIVIFFIETREGWVDDDACFSPRVVQNHPSSRRLLARDAKKKIDKKNDDDDDDVP